MKNFGIIFFILLVSIAYSIFVWWFFTENEAAITGKPVNCGPVRDTVSVVDTLKDFNPIVQHSRIRKK
jgi:hypothetical protein